MCAIRSFVLFWSMFASPVFGQDLPRIFLTSVSGNGDLSTWPDAHGLNGVAAGDEICKTRAAAASIPHSQNYMALLSTSTSDAYCRLHGLQGQRDSNCGLAQLPTNAGPWYRIDGLAAWDIALNSLPEWNSTGYMPRPIKYDEFGQSLPLDVVESQLAFTGTENSGNVYVFGTCDDWTNPSEEAEGGKVNAYRTYGMLDGYSSECNYSSRLVCLAQGAFGAQLPRNPSPNHRIAFVTSATGTGNLSSWADAGAASGVAAGDMICRAHALRAGLASPDSYKAWLSVLGANAKDRFEWDGPWFRRDGVRVATSMADLVDGEIEAPLQVDETGSLVGFTSAWTATSAAGTLDLVHPAATCRNWTDGSMNYGANTGTTNATEMNWSSSPSGGDVCSAPIRLYCFSDTDSIFVSSFE